jgi:inhibitor of KinA sporulation pathway (predicted exonuclease)
VSMIFSRPYLAVVDFEATCGYIPHAETEIIDWGCVLIKTCDFSLVEVNSSSFSSFVKPSVHPILSVFCKDLTGISQQEASWAPSFEATCGAFFSWLQSICSPEHVTLGSWGEFDPRQLKRQCEALEITLPPLDWINLRTEVMLALKIHKNEKSNVRSVIERLGGSFEGRPHRGINDCKTIAKILKLTAQKKG